LTGYEEIIPAALPKDEGGAVSTTGRGSFRARVEREGSSFEIEYRLRYEALEGADTLQAHIHFGQRHTLGGISAFLCDSTLNNGIPDCTNTNGDITGTIEAADVIGPAGQGIEPQAITELIRAMQNGATYVNVHTDKWPSGEIRGQIGHGHHFVFVVRGKGKRGGGDD
jgi:CHRD domain